MKQLDVQVSTPDNDQPRLPRRLATCRPATSTHNLGRHESVQTARDLDKGKKIAPDSFSSQKLRQMAMKLGEIMF